MANSVNISRPTGAALERALAQKLRELLAGVSWLKDWRVECVPMDDRRGFDITAALPLPHGSKAELRVVCKANPRPSQFPLIRAQDHSGSQGKRPNQVWVVSAPHISSRMAQLCREHGWSWFDLAGNCYLNVPNAFLLERIGLQPVHAPPKSTANLGTAEAGRIVRALLAPDNAGQKWTQRDLQLHVQPNVSIGLVNKVARHLREEAFVEESADGGFKLRDPLVLLRDALLQPPDLLVHAQQHRDDDVLALPVDRLGLGALHNPGFDTARLCPPDQLNAYSFVLICRDVSAEF